MLRKHWPKPSKGLYRLPLVGGQIERTSKLRVATDPGIIPGAPLGFQPWANALASTPDTPLQQQRRKQAKYKDKVDLDEIENGWYL